MGSSDPIQPFHFTNRNYRLIGGAALVFIGAAILLDRYLKTGWLALLVLPAVGLFFLLSGVRSHSIGLIVPGGLLSGLGIGALITLSVFAGSSWQARLGIALLAFALGWASITLAIFYTTNQVLFWPLIPASVIGAVGAALVFSPARPLDFALYLSTALGLAFILWGTYDRLIGLIIPGCLLIGLGPGTFLAWGTSHEANSLAQVGIQLVCFALGWGLITVFSRLITDTFLWWPLIPGGILAMVGWGLYIGGNPGNALSFISNTGSIGLIIFGLYLLLWRKGIQR